MSELKLLPKFHDELHAPHAGYHSGISKSYRCSFNGLLVSTCLVGYYELFGY